MGLTGDKVHQDAGTLSGGEKTKLALGILVAGRHNLLLLDEPTNNLDPGSREAVAEGLRGWPGSIVLVSHDAAFVRDLAARPRAAHARGHPRPLGRRLPRPGRAGLAGHRAASPGRGSARAEALRRRPAPGVASLLPPQVRLGAAKPPCRRARQPAPASLRSCLRRCGSATRRRAVWTTHAAAPGPKPGRCTGGPVRLAHADPDRHRGAVRGHAPGCGCWCRARRRPRSGWRDPGRSGCRRTPAGPSCAPDVAGLAVDVQRERLGPAQRERRVVHLDPGPPRGAGARLIDRPRVGVDRAGSGPARVLARVVVGLGRVPVGDEQARART